MNPTEYWKQLETEILNFNDKKILPSNDTDSQEYKKQTSTLLSVATLGCDAEKCWTVIGKKPLLEKVDALLNNKDSFGEGGIPVIAGKLTRDFIESVYIPHLKRLANVTFDKMSELAASALKLIGKGEDLPGRIRLAQEKAEILKKEIEKYDAAQPSINNHNLFSSTSKIVMDVPSATQETGAKPLSPK